MYVLAEGQSIDTLYQPLEGKYELRLYGVSENFAMSENILWDMGIAKIPNADIVYIKERNPIIAGWQILKNDGFNWKWALVAFTGGLLLLRKKTV